MRLAALWLLPVAAGVVCYVLPPHRAGRLRAGILVAAAAVHSMLVATLWVRPAPPAFDGWLAADALGLIVLTLTSVLFLATSLYTVGYLRRERPRGGRIFVAGLLGFLAAATIVTLSQHLAMLWVGMEATTLSLAPLIFHRHDRRSLEAVWKYLVLSSVGIALALLGVFFLATSQQGVAGRPLILADLLAHATELHPAWLRAAFIFLFVGYGTKMGLAPMHTWKPDTYGEAPGLVGGLMAGALTSCAFIGVARTASILTAAGLGSFMQPVLIGFGLLSLVVAAAFILRQSDLKRLLAYSSVEHMGLLVLGLGLGGAGAYGAVLHALNNGLAKGWLFLVAGNVVLARGGAGAAQQHGLVRILPASGVLLVLGLFAVTGSPPFGLFISEFTILRAAAATRHPWVAAAMLLLLAIIFIGMARLILGLALGSAAPETTTVRESRWLIAGPLALAVLVLMLGLYIPAPLRTALARAAAGLGGHRAMSTLEQAGLRNRRAVPLGAIATEPIESFRRTVIDAVATDWRIVACFGLTWSHADTRLIAVLANDGKGELGATSAIVHDRYPALTPDCAQASRFEREIAEQCAVLPEGHPWLKPLRRHLPDHRPPDRTTVVLDPGDHPFARIEGAEVHEVAVGPVHAGIIEPGHFRFQTHGEDVLSLEVMLGYQHRGVECLLETVDRDRAVLIAESIAGDTVIGHAGAFCGAIEALTRTHKSPRAQTIRGIALELERLANHIGDLGAIAGDVAFQPAAAFFGRMRGECLNLLMTLSGNRFGRGLIRPGGVGFDLPDTMAGAMGERLQSLRAELEPVAKLMFSSASVQARLEGAGIVPRERCLELGLVGTVARACGVVRDVRNDHPYGVFRFAHIPVATAWDGDVLARALVRRLEIGRSLEFVLEQLAALPRGEPRITCDALQPDEIVVAMQEGWRGEIAHVVVTDERGSIRRYKIVDPSFHNWSAVGIALPGNAISDFPLCNKSFNLSYAGHDL